MNQRFKNRSEAGRLLGERLNQHANRKDVMILALPRGGVPVGFEVAQRLHAPLDVFVVRKLGLPGHPELAMGAIASGGIRVLNDVVVYELDIPKSVIDAVARDEELELRRREWAYRGHGEPLPIEGNTVILVDDGIATGSTMRAAARAVRHQRPARLIVAAPVVSMAATNELRREADELVALLTPREFLAVGRWYQNFDQTTDQEVTALLNEASHQRRATAQTQS
jgi:putative phosphoribosyl transferase